MKPKNTRILSVPAAALASLALIQFTANAATLSKADNTNDLNLATSWSGSVVPGANDIAQWDSTVTAANSTLVGANLSFAGVKVTDPAGAVTFGAGNTITVGTSGIDLSTATQNLTIGSGLTLKGKQNWKTIAGRTLDISGTFSKGSGSVDFTKFSGTLGTLPSDGSGILGAWGTRDGATAIATATISSGTVTALTLVGENSGYATAPTVTIQAPASGTTATATAIVASGVVTGFTITNVGSGYTSIPRVNIAPTATRINYAVPSTAAAYTGQTAGTAADLSNVTSATTNYSFGATATLTTDITANTLRFQGATCGLVNTANKNITLNGLMSAGNTGSGSGGVLTVGSAGAATSTTNQIKIGASGVLNIATAVDNNYTSGSAPSSSMVINMPITGIGSSVVVNAGPKDLILLGSGTTKTTNPRSTFSRIFINSGYVRLPVLGDGTLGGYATPNGSTVTADGALVTIEKGAELRFDRNNILGSLTLNGGTVSFINSFADTWGPATNPSSFTLNADSTFYSGATGKLTVSVPITGSGGIIKTGAGTASLILNGASTYTGPTVINGGVLSLTKANALYNADQTKWTAANITVNPVQSPLTASAPTPTLLLSVGGTDEFTASQLSTLITNLTASVNNNGLQAGSYLAINTANATSDVVVSANLINSVGTGGGSINFKTFGKGTVKLTGNNTYSGKTAVDGIESSTGVATLSFASLNSVVGGTASSNLGAPTTVANGTIDLGNSGSQNKRVTLSYTGTGETTDRVINFAGQFGSSNAIEQAGTGVLKFTSPFTFYGTASDEDKDVILQGNTAGTGEIAGAIADPTLGGSTNIGVSKRGSGTWTLSGVNTYTGTTSVWEGKLIIGGASKLGGGSYAADIALTSNFSGGPTGANTEIFFNSSANQTLSGFIYSNGTTGTLRKGGASTLTLAPVASVNATATATLTGDTVSAITLTPNTGTGYEDVPITVTITGGGGTGATATGDVYFFDGKVTITLVSGGSGYTSIPTVTISPAAAPYRSNVCDNTIVEAGVLATNGYALYDDSSLFITGGKVSVTAGQTEVVKYLSLGGVAKAPGTYGPTGSGATNIDDTYFTAGTGIVQSTSTAIPPYNTWTADNGLDGLDALPTADADADSMANAIEFVLGGIADPLDPGNMSVALLPQGTRNLAGDLVFTFPRKLVSLTSTVVFQWSTDLTFPAGNDVPIGATGSTTNGVTVAVTSLNSTTDTIVVTVPAAKAVGGKVFGRLKSTVTQ
jgi:autotransporter-associated beta strand protein